MTRSISVLAVASSLAAAPAAAEMRLGDLVEAARLAGSQSMMVHVLSYEGLPDAALEARELVLQDMGSAGSPGPCPAPTSASRRS